MKYVSSKNYPLRINKQLVVQPGQVIDIPTEQLTKELMKVIQYKWLVPHEGTDEANIVYNKVDTPDYTTPYVPEITPELQEDFIKVDDSEQEDVVKQTIVRVKKKTPKARKFK